MKKNILSVLLLLCAIVTQAQITLTSTNVRVPLGTDSAFSVLLRTNNASTIALPTEGANRTWDYRRLNDSVAVSVSYTAATAATDAAYPTATAYAPLNPTFGPIALRTGRTYYNASTNGYYNLGYRQQEGAYGLGALSIFLAPTDSIYIFANPASVLTGAVTSSTVATPTPKLTYPCTFNSAWRVNNKQITVGAVTIAFASYNRAPFEVRQYYTTRDSVVGWGKVIIPKGTGASVPIDALLVKHFTEESDSVYLNGVPASDLLLSQFGLAQGRKMYDTDYSFYGLNQTRPLLTLSTNQTFTTCIGGSYNRSSSILSGSNELDNAVFSAVQISPNPIIANVLQANFDKPSEANWTLRIVDLEGRLMQTNTLSGSGKVTATVELGKNMTNGTYIYSLINENDRIVGVGKFSVSR
jgi:hypothetical protein